MKFRQFFRYSMKFCVNPSNFQNYWLRYKTKGPKKRYHIIGKIKEFNVIRKIEESSYNFFFHCEHYCYCHSHYYRHCLYFYFVLSIVSITLSWHSSLAIKLLLSNCINRFGLTEIQLIQRYRQDLFAENGNSMVLSYLEHLLRFPLTKKKLVD